MDVTGAVDPYNLFSAKGLGVAITGGGSGIGLAMATSIYKTGASKVYILGRRLDVLSTSAAALDPSGTVVVPLQCDVCSPVSIKAASQRISQETGHLDVLINNAGSSGPVRHPTKQPADRIEQLAEEMLEGFDDGKWIGTLETNTASIVAISANFLPLLEKGNQRRGWQGGRIPLDAVRQRNADIDAELATDDRMSQIITVASIAAIERGGITGLAYKASKAGSLHLGKSLATMLVPWGIRSNVVTPGLFPSEMTVGLPAVWPVGHIPASRSGTLHDVAGVVLYLVGKSGSFLNGAVMVADGGQLSQAVSSY